MPTRLRVSASCFGCLRGAKIKPVGGTPDQIDARVISATNKDLSELVKAKTFRQDLYYRLAVLPLYLPPLRERLEDIPLLVEHFVAGSCKRHRQPVRQVSPDAMQALTQASWPGNVRELQHYLERAVVTTTGPELTCKDMMAMGSEPGGHDLRTVARGPPPGGNVADSSALQRQGAIVPRLKLSRSPGEPLQQLRTYQIH